MSKKAKVLIIGFSISLVVLILVFYLGLEIQAPDKNNKQLQIFEIKEVTPSLQIATNLKEENLIKSKWLFLFYLKLKRGVIQAGTYELSPSYNLPKTVSILTTGQVKEWLVTFPEGFSLKDMGERLEKKGIVKKEDFLKEVSLVSKYKIDFPFLSEIKSSNLEGYLFPDTYRFSLGVSSEEIIKKILLNFDKKITAGIKEKIKGQGKTLQETIVLASIVEREAKKEDERAKIASVYLNRLKKGMKLEADPTIQYAKGNWEAIVKEDYENINSPYNTYKYPGLPPGPICNPGLASILAVLNPEKTDYLYFFHTKDGQTIYSQTKEEHERKKGEYLK